MNPQELAAKVGEVIGTSEWAEMSQERINQFAEATGDHQFIHINPDMAKMTPFGGTIAHGFLTLSMLSKLMATSGPAPATKMSVNYGFNKVRFLTPVRSGSRIRAHFKLLELEEKRPGQWQQCVEATVEIEGSEKPAFIAEWLFQHFV
jgi:acyl dehydratase